MTRGDLQILADDRVADAAALLEAGRAVAYYLLGYAVECAFKACIARQLREYEVPGKSLINSFYTHHLDTLLIVSGAKDILVKKRAAEPKFGDNWYTVEQWSEVSRYDHSTTADSARQMYAAVCDEDSGVLTWLKTMW